MYRYWSIPWELSVANSPASSPLSKLLSTILVLFLCTFTEKVIGVVPIWISSLMWFTHEVNANVARAASVVIRRFLDV